MASWLERRGSYGPCPSWIRYISVAGSQPPEPYRYIVYCPAYLLRCIKSPLSLAVGRVNLERESDGDVGLRVHQWTAELIVLDGTSDVDTAAVGDPIPGHSRFTRTVSKRKDRSVPDECRTLPDRKCDT